MKHKAGGGFPKIKYLGFLIIVATVIILTITKGEQWLRRFFIYLSHAVWARQLVSSLPIAKRVARRFVAGETIGEAMTAASKLNQQGMDVTLDYLGESVTDEQEAEAARDEILRLLEQINLLELDANVSVKLTQLGLRIDKKIALNNMRLILERASLFDNKVRIDMEESDLVDNTLELYRTLRDRDDYDNVGVVIQSYLFRSESDVRQLIEEGAWVRLCKGAYAEPANIAFADKADTDESYVELTKLLLGPKAQDKGVYLGIATHDEKMIDAALRYANSQEISKKKYEFQMLYGIQRDLQRSLIEQGYQVRIYVPYGTAWYPYLVRRLAERPANLWFFVSNFFKR
jgi:proline dehydrogenase